MTFKKKIKYSYSVVIAFNTDNPVYLKNIRHKDFSANTFEQLLNKITKFRDKIFKEEKHFCYIKDVTHFSLTAFHYMNDSKDFHYSYYMSASTYDSEQKQILIDLIKNFTN